MPPRLSSLADGCRGTSGSQSGRDEQAATVRLLGLQGDAALEQLAHPVTSLGPSDLPALGGRREEGMD